MQRDIFWTWSSRLSYWRGQCLFCALHPVWQERLQQILAEIGVSPQALFCIHRFCIDMLWHGMFSHMRTKIWDGLSRIANCDRIWQRAMFDLILLDLYGFNLIICMRVQDGSRTISDLKNIENSIGSIRSNKLCPMMSNPPEGLQFFWSFAIQDIKASLSGRFGGGLNCWECFCLPFWSVLLLDALKFWT